MKSEIKTAVLTILAIFVAVALAWGLLTGFSYWWGQGNAYRHKNSADNWVAAQRSFHQEYNDVQAFRAKIGSARDQLNQFNTAHPNVGNGTPYDPLLQEQEDIRANITGLQQQCQNTIVQYNTDAESYLTEDWRDAGLPDQLDQGLCS